MKLATGILVLALILLAVFGTPLDEELLVEGTYYGSPQRILPMNFAHHHHAKEQCVTCHHNYVDDTGGGMCMGCHVSDEKLLPLLETQFHDLCMGCHIRKSATGEEGGPPRQCIECHVTDPLP
ncbi:MAG: cytochrome c3 family protein [Halioglobus sp.]